MAAIPLERSEQNALYKLHLAITVAEQWIPLGAYLTPANTANDLAALPLIAHLPHSMRYVLGNQS